ncbi:hypothetical protein D3C84_1137160 [compost metagenome]
MNGNFGTPALSSAYTYGTGLRVVPTPTPKPVARGNTTTQISAPIHIVQQPGQSGADVAQEVRRELDRRERQAAANGRASLSDRN